ncbi:unnamed protein product, partial [Meganyctiphanes norvegica]
MRKRLEKVGDPYGNCTNGGDKYTQVLCKKVCLESAVWKNCNCSIGINPAFEDSLANLTKLAGMKERPTDPCSPFNASQKICRDIQDFDMLQRKLTCDICYPECSE